MNASIRLALTGALLAGTLGSCQIKQPLAHDAYSLVKKGTQSVGASTGWAWVDADITLTGKTGVLSLAGSGTDTAELDPVAGGGIKYSRFFTDDFALTAIFEARVFDAEPASPLTAPLDAKEFTTLHFILGGRYFLNPFGKENRFRPFLGLDLGYVPGIDTDAIATFPDPMGGAPIDRDVALDGDEFWTLGAVGGISYLLRDNLTFDTGFFYEWALDSTDDTITVVVPTPFGDSISTADGEVEEEGLYYFAGLTFFF